MARTGIGAITLIDMDDVCVTNTNRQIHALRHNIGQAKTEVMAERILAINPECHVTCIDDFITADNVAELLNKISAMLLMQLIVCAQKLRCCLTAVAIKSQW